MSLKRTAMLLAATAALSVGATISAAGPAAAAEESFAKMAYDLHNGQLVQFDNRGTGQPDQSCEAILWKGDHVSEVKRNLTFPYSMIGNTNGRYGGLDQPIIGRTLPGVGPDANAKSTAYFYKTNADGDWLGNVSDLVNNDDPTQRSAITKPSTALVSCTNLGNAVVLLSSGATKDTWYAGETIKPYGSLDGIIG
ncbi:hypothetical protein [Gordonia sp. NB41Y]|uniref:hypothetical protein n=1 Tax=Gordonia sp. NB41Y TaxID=875808 RepID=UPI00128F4787|nr:hypothetical protein [Gordonia sp. NB41Y]WLP90593.1 hypothetical protein Q9K23_24400 [Gordonia sp. NB41Y]